MNYLISSIGHPTAGKTTTLRFLSAQLGCPFVSEGTIKRNLVGNDYNVNNSMDENLRSKGYKIAISRAIDLLRCNKFVILDASFHQLFRRLWIYDEIINQQLQASVIWIYCYCNNLSEVIRRFDARSKAKVITPDIQARSIDVYHYTMKTFDTVNIHDFPLVIPTSIVYNNTEIGKVEKIDSNCHSILKQANEISSLIY